MNNNDALAVTLADGRLEDAREAVAAGTVFPTDQSSQLQYLEHAIRRNHFEMVKWIMQLAPDVPVRQSSLEAVLQWNNAEIFKWLCTKSQKRLNLTVEKNHLVRRAAAKDATEIIQWLVAESRQRVDVTANTNEVLWIAIENNNLPLVIWLLRDCRDAMRQNPAWNGRDIPEVRLQFRDPLNFIIEQDNAEVFQWLVTESGLLPQIIATDPDFLREYLRMYDDNQGAQFLEFLEAKKAETLVELDSLILQAAQSAVCRKAFQAGLIRNLADVTTVLDRAATIQKGRKTTKL